jgi:hypothetical protein
MVSEHTLIAYQFFVMWHNGIPTIKKMKARDLLFLLVATWSLCSLPGCRSFIPVVHTPIAVNFTQPAANNSSTPNENKNVTEISPPLIVVPIGSPPTIDGTFSPGEWDDAIAENFADGSQLLLLQAGDFIYLGIKANESGTIAANVFIHRGDYIEILHSSAALGTAVYKKSEDGWEQTQGFTWRCQNTGNSETAQAERAEFLKDEGWLASNGLMGTPNELEYQIKIPDQDFRLATVYIKATYPYEKVPWPVKLDDDCIQPASGGLPLVMQFLPAQWATLEFSR